MVGDVCVDVIARHRGRPVPGSDTDAVIRTTGGGAGANTAAWLATLGMAVTLVARVGDDPAGTAQLTELRGYGVRCACAVDPEASTGAIVSLVDATGERTMLADRGANLRLRPTDLPARLPAGGHLHLSGYTLLHPDPRPAGLAALARARAAGLTVSVDPASSAPLAAVGPATFLSWTDGADLLLPNQAEAAVLTGLADPVAAALALATRHRAVAVKLGADGALWAHGGEVSHLPAVPVDPSLVVDTTGAGDAFGAGLLAAWLDGAPGPDALRRGAETAAIAITHLGARPTGHPTDDRRGRPGLPASST